MAFGERSHKLRNRSPAFSPSCLLGGWMAESEPKAPRQSIAAHGGAPQLRPGWRYRDRPCGVLSTNAARRTLVGHERHAARHTRRVVAPARTRAPRLGREASARLPRADAASPVSGSPIGPGRGTEVPRVGADSRRPSSARREPRGNLNPARTLEPGLARWCGEAFPSCDSLTRVSNRVRPRTAQAGRDAASRVRSETV